MWYWVLLGYMWCGSGYDQVRCGHLAHGLVTTGAGSHMQVSCSVAVVTLD